VIFKTPGAIGVILNPYIAIWVLPEKINSQMRLWEVKT
jgi:hypothetical protein